MAFQAVIAAVAVGGSVASIQQGRKAQKAGERQAAAQRKQEQAKAARSRRAALRESQMKRAQTVARADAVGAAQGSGVSGGLSSLQSQLGSGLGYASQQTGLSNQISIAGVQQQAALTRAGAYSSIAGLGFQALGGSFGDLGGGGGGPQPMQSVSGPMKTSTTRPRLPPA